MIEKVRKMIEKRNRRVRTVKELGKMTDRELNDIGISRYDIPRISRECI